MIQSHLQFKNITVRGAPKYFQASFKVIYQYIDRGLVKIVGFLYSLLRKNNNALNHNTHCSYNVVVEVNFLIGTIKIINSPN